MSGTSLFKLRPKRLRCLCEGKPGQESTVVRNEHLGVPIVKRFLAKYLGLAHCDKGSRVPARPKQNPVWAAGVFEPVVVEVGEGIAGGVRWRVEHLPRIGEGA